MTGSFSRVKEVFDDAAMYRAVIDADYMHHAELVVALTDWAHEQSEPLRIVDLGCGDASLATEAFKNATVASYRGVDVADAALDIARKNVAIWSGRAEVVAGNLAEFLHAQLDGSANLVLASYSLHHFSSDSKIELISNCRCVLTTGGTFIWIDAVRRDGESRGTYIDRLTHTMANDWTALTTDQRARACAHVHESDFPETRQWMLDRAAAAGFERTDTVLRREFFDGWVFSKGSSN
jgi:ubiquinone/menaquinone biosynthesis C-methylase UbiE